MDAEILTPGPEIDLNQPVHTPTGKADAIYYLDGITRASGGFDDKGNPVFIKIKESFYKQALRYLKAPSQEYLNLSGMRFGACVPSPGWLWLIPRHKPLMELETLSKAQGRPMRCLFCCDMPVVPNYTSLPGHNTVPFRIIDENILGQWESATPEEGIVCLKFLGFPSML